MVMPSPSFPAHIGSQASDVPNPEVLEKAQRRIYTAEYKLGILQETDTCAEGQIGAILRREGLYSSHRCDLATTTTGRTTGCFE